MKTVILAGGYGTRIGEETHLRPKPMIEIGEKPILWHIMKYYSAFNFNDFIICCGHRGNVIKEYFADYYLHRSDVTFDYTDKGKGEMTVHGHTSEPWRVTLIDTGANVETGGRVKRIQDYVGNERFMLTYGDGVSNVDLSALLNQHNRTGKLVTLTAIQPGGRFGVLNIDGDSVTSFREKATEDGGWVNAGFMVAEPDLFNYLDDDRTVLERAPLERLSSERNLGVYKHFDYWQCMDTQRDKRALEELWNTGTAPWKVWQD
jgi:glucose-1-phosphate cytidylyltransferase